MAGVNLKPASVAAPTVAAVEGISEVEGTPIDLTAVGDSLFFVAQKEVTPGQCRHVLWKSDGTEDGTVMVKDIRPLSDCNAGEWFTDVNGTLFFTAVDVAQLWKSDGTEGGTAMVKDIDPGGYSAALTNMDGILFLTADDGEYGSELWKSDGTEAGTVMVKNILRDGSSRPASLTDVNGTLFFLADDPLHPPTLGNSGSQLWKSDGTEDGTVMVKDINPDPGTAFATGLTDVNGTLFFTANDGTGRRLWKSDGTESGTIVVKDINPGGSSILRGLTDVNGTLFFVGGDGSQGDRLWKSDGTETGTGSIGDIRPLSVPSTPFLTAAGGLVFFVADDGTHGRELWKSDGTVDGTVLVKDINPDPAGSPPTQFTDVAGTLFFTALGGLWKSDGTEDGTVLVKEVGASSPTHVAGTLFFVVDKRELWSSDGTADGTVMVKDIDPTPPSEDRGRTIGLSRRSLRSSGIAQGVVRLEEAGRPAAVRRVAVRIQRAPLGTNNWRTIRRPKTDRSGAYRTVNRILRPNGQPRPGRYRAVAPRFTFTANDGTEVTALRTVSPIRRVPRR